MMIKWLQHFDYKELSHNNSNWWSRHYTANMIQDPKRSWSNKLIIHKNLLQVFVCGNPPNLTDFLSKQFPLTERILDNSKLCLLVTFLQRHKRSTTSNSALHTVDTWFRQSLPWSIMETLILLDNFSISNFTQEMIFAPVTNKKLAIHKHIRYPNVPLVSFSLNL